MKKLYTRFLSLVLVLTMLLSVFNSLFIIAAAVTPPAEAAVFSVTSVKGVAGKTVEVEVRVSENSQICAGDWELNFDSSKLLFESFEGGDILSVGMYAYNANVSDCIKVSFSSLEPIVDGGLLFKAIFLLTSDDYNEQINVNFTVSSLVTTESNKAEYSVKSGHVEVVDVLYGDIDQNNRISAVDVLRVLTSLTGETLLTEDQNKIADVNGDGKINAVDALQILYFTAEMGDTLYLTDEGQIDFYIYNLQAPKNIQIKDLHEYSFTIGWDDVDYAIGYNIYFNGEKINQYMLTDNSVTIGCTATGEVVGDASIAKYLHNSIDHNTNYTIEVSAINVLKESEKSVPLDVKTKRHHSSVVFKNWDGAVLDEQRVLFGQDAVVPNNPTKTGYDFIGWDKSTTNIIDDAVITALYEIQKYDYTFYNWNGEQLSKQTVVYQGTATPPSNPVRTGYTFNGWYTALSGGEKVTDFSNATGAREYYAQYTVNKYTFSFDSKGGTAVGNYTGDYGTNVTAPTNPTKYSYVFGGWYTNDDCMQKWDFDKNSIECNTTLYAKWIPIVITIDKSKLNFTSTGATQQLNVSFSSGSDTVKWYSDNNNVATVDINTGLVTSKGHGTANIYIEGTNSARRAVCVVTVVAKKDAWVTGTGRVGLNLRKSPTTDSTAILVIPELSQLEIFGEEQNGWYNASYNGKNGFVYSSYISFEKPKMTNATPSVITGTFAEKLRQLQAKMPAGYYWNGRPDDRLHVQSYPAHSCGFCPDYGCNDCGSFYNNSGKWIASSCCGYARVIAFSLYGKDIGWYLYDVGKNAPIMAGDIVYYKYNGKGNHYIFITKVYTSGGVTYVEFTDANGQGSKFGNCNKIRWGEVKPVSDFQTKDPIVNIYRNH